MRPHQQCLLLTSGFDGTEPAVPDRAQTARLRDFVRAALARKSPSSVARDIDLPHDPQGWATPPQCQDQRRALTPVEPEHAMVAFDLASLLHQPHLRKYAALAAPSLARDMALIAASADPMPALVLLQDALRHARGVVAFGDAAGRELAMLGAVGVAVTPPPALPPISPSPSGPDRTVVCLFDHEPARGRSASVAAAVTEALPAATVVAAGDALPVPALHLHLGTRHGDDAAPRRVVDSFAARCPVVHLLDRAPRAGSSECPGMAVDPMQTGILAGTLAEAVAGLARLAADPALADAFRSHADRAAAAFNRRIEDRMREALP